MCRTVLSYTTLVTQIAVRYHTLSITDMLFRSIQLKQALYTKKQKYHMNKLT